MLFGTPNSVYSTSNEINDYGLISLMYHRFEENKYPSTNIKKDDFEEHIKEIKNNKIAFINPNNFENSIKNQKNERKILLTFDDGFLSFYEVAWPILRKEKIPFILFVNTREVGSYNYMNWSQIKEIAKEDFAHIGNHSHSHEYLVDMSKDQILEDLKKSILIFNKELGFQSDFFSYPFGEYSLNFKEIVRSLGFKYAFGQHSGVIDETKDFLELPRFPINEKYGEIKRFKSLVKSLPFKYKKILPEEKYILENFNPPNVSIEFFENFTEMNKISCYSNEEDKWRKSTLEFSENQILKIELQGKFTTERGRINCSINAGNGFWRWLGMQFVIAEN